MTTAKFGVQMIEKFEKMVRDDFKPLFDVLNERERQIRDEVEVIVKKELGIYDLFIKEKKLELELEETQREVRRWKESKNRVNDGRSKLDCAIDAKMSLIMNGEKNRLQEARAEQLRNVGLMAIDDERMRNSLIECRETVNKFIEEFKSLPPVSTKIKALTGKK